MGKSITESEYRSAGEKLSNCRGATCRNHTGVDHDQFCNGCKAAYKTRKEFERTHKQANN